MNQGSPFRLGINQPWFFGAYGNDLGDSQYSGRALWHWPHTAPLPSMESLTIRQITGAPPRASIADIESRMANYRGLDVVRVWLHEQFEGLIFDSNGRVTGISIPFIDSVRRLLDVAAKYGVKLYPTLFNAWDTFPEPPSNLPKIRLQYYDAWLAVKQSLMNRIVRYPVDYWTNALRPLLSKISGHPALYAVDIMNEPEGLKLPGAGSIGQTIAPFVNGTYRHLQAFGSRVSVGCMTPELAKYLAKNTKIDFADFHIYNPSGIVPQYYREDFNGKPCLLGEVGYPINKEPNNLRMREIYEESVAFRFIQQAHLKGYCGALVWGVEDFAVGDNATRLLGKMQNLVKGRLTVRPPPANHWAIFLSYFGIR